MRPHSSVYDPCMAGSDGRGSLADWVAALATLLIGLAGVFIGYAANELGRQQSASAHFDTTQTCAVYRDQVLRLRDEYGMTALDIQDLLQRENDFLVDGGPEGIEHACGAIEAIVGIPPKKAG